MCRALANRGNKDTSTSLSITESRNGPPLGKYNDNNVLTARLHTAADPVVDISVTKARQGGCYHRFFGFRPLTRVTYPSQERTTSVLLPWNNRKLFGEEHHDVNENTILRRSQVTPSRCRNTPYIFSSGRRLLSVEGMLR